MHAKRIQGELQLWKQGVYLTRIIISSQSIIKKNIPVFNRDVELMGTLFICPKDSFGGFSSKQGSSLLHLWRRVRDEVNCNRPGYRN